jgi:hypothetical protein
MLPCAQPGGGDCVHAGAVPGRGRQLHKPSPLCPAAAAAAAAGPAPTRPYLEPRLLVDDRRVVLPLPLLAQLRQRAGEEEGHVALRLPVLLVKVLRGHIHLVGAGRHHNVLVGHVAGALQVAALRRVRREVPAVARPALRRHQDLVADVRPGLVLRPDLGVELWGGAAACQAGARVVWVVRLHPALAGRRGVAPHQRRRARKGRAEQPAAVPPAGVQARPGAPSHGRPAAAPAPLSAHLERVAGRVCEAMHPAKVVDDDRVPGDLVGDAAAAKVVDSHPDVVPALVPRPVGLLCAEGSVEEGHLQGWGRGGRVGGPALQRRPIGTAGGWLPAAVGAEAASEVPAGRPAGGGGCSPWRARPRRAAGPSPHPSTSASARRSSRRLLGPW